MSVGHSSTNEPLITASNQGSPSRQRESTAGSVAAEMAAGQPLPRTPPTEAYNTLSPVSGPYPTAITTGIPRGSPTRPTFGQNQTESPIHDAPPQGPRTSRRATSGYYTAQPEVDITERNEMQNGDEGYGFPEARMRTLSRRGTMGPVKTASIEDEKNAIDWIVPKSGGPLSRGVSMLGEKRRTVEERLQATLDAAKMELVKYQKKAQMAGLAINVALFAQIISNALITGLSAATSNRHAQIGVSALGALGTIISSFLVRVRGTREPDRSTAHSQNLEKFIRELEAFILDEGGSYDRKWDAEVKRFRTEFDRLQTAIHQSENGQPITDNSAPAPTVTPAHAVTPGPTTPGFGTPGPTTPGLGTPGFGGKIA